MAILCDSQIRDLCKDKKTPLISPFTDTQNKTLVRELTEVEKALLSVDMLKVQGAHLRMSDLEDLSTPKTSTRLVVVDGELKIQERQISYGLSSYGYDVRLATEFMVFTNVTNGVLDPKDVDPSCFHRVEGEVCVIPPNSFVLARTLEYFHMPKDVTALVFSKSTYARVGTQAFATVIEAGWHGQIVLEYANNTPLPVKLYANEGAAQLLFFKGDPCETPYDHTRKYQGQTGITLSRM